MLLNVVQFQVDKNMRKKNAAFIRELKERTRYNFLIYTIQANYDSISANLFSVLHTINM